MLQKYYTQLCEEVSPKMEAFKESFHQIGNTPSEEYLCDFQNQLIAFGTELEKKYHIEETPFLKSLEMLIEYLYELTLPDSMADEILQAIEKELSSYEDKIKKSVLVSDVDLSLVLIIKNETEYLEEWLEFHRMLGVGHFYIYDNESTDGLTEFLNSYIESGLVTYHLFPGEDVQIKAYDHALEYYKYDTRYMGFIDTDEFLFPVEGDSLPQTIDEIICDFHAKKNRVDYAGGIGVNWRVYGAGYHKEKPEGLVIENYRYRGADSYEMNELIKVICNPVVVQCFERYPHNVKYGSDRIVTISENGSTIPRAYFYDSKCEKLRINHYYTRSEAEYREKVFKRGWTGLTKEAYERFKSDCEQKLTECYDVEDYMMERFVERLKKRMNKGE